MFHCCKLSDQLAGCACFASDVDIVSNICYCQVVIFYDRLNISLISVSLSKTTIPATGSPAAYAVFAARQHQQAHLIQHAAIRLTFLVIPASTNISIFNAVIIT